MRRSSPEDLARWDPVLEWDRVLVLAWDPVLAPEWDPDLVLAWRLALVPTRS